MLFPGRLVVWPLLMLSTPMLFSAVLADLLVLEAQ